MNSRSSLVLLLLVSTIIFFCVATFTPALATYDPAGFFLWRSSTSSTQTACVSVGGVKIYCATSASEIIEIDPIVGTEQQILSAVSSQASFAPTQNPVILTSLGLLFLGSEGPDNTFYAIDVVNKNVKWSQKGDGKFQGSPTLATISGTNNGNPCIIVGDSGSSLHIFDAASGAVLLKYPSAYAIRSTPIFSSNAGVLLYGDDRPGFRAVALEMANGTLAATLTWSQSVVANSTTQGVTSRAVVTENDAVLWGDAAGHVYKTTVVAGTKISPVLIGDVAIGSMLYDQASALTIFGTSSGDLIVFDSGLMKVKNRLPLTGDLSTQMPLIVENEKFPGGLDYKMLYLGSSKGMMHAIRLTLTSTDPATLTTLLWQEALGNDPMTSAISINGTVFVGLNSATPALYALSPCFAFNNFNGGEAMCPLTCRAVFGGTCPSCSFLTNLQSPCESVVGVSIAKCSVCHPADICTDSAIGCDCQKFSEQQCEASAPTACKYCANQGICSSASNNCDCQNYTKAVCNAAKPGTCHWCPLTQNEGICASPNNSACACEAFPLDRCTGLCHVCSDLNTCASVETNPNCSCFAYTTSATCPTSGGCKWCSSQGVCAKTCDCFTFPSATCQVATTCTWCAEAKLCSTDSSCRCRTFNSAGLCAEASNKCLWCKNQSKCTDKSKNPDCSCPYWSSPSSSDCPSPGCNYCPAEQICAPTSNPNCMCDQYSNSVCDLAKSSTCHWCGAQYSQNTCAPIQSNPNCLCENYNEQICKTQAQPGCSFCGNMDLCMNQNIDCNCNNITDPTLCGKATGCNWCESNPGPDGSKLSICINATQKCNCNYFDQHYCPTSGSDDTCQWCPSQKICIPSGKSCSCDSYDHFGCVVAFLSCRYCDSPLGVCVDRTSDKSHDCDCNTMSSATCQRTESTACDYCPTLKICRNVNNAAAPAGSNQQQCSCSYFDQQFCPSSECHYCGAATSYGDQNICAVSQTNPNCDCNRYTSTRECSLASPGCKWCDALNICVDSATNEDCTCTALDYFGCTQTAGICSFCSSQNVCTNSSLQPLCSCNFYDKTVCDKANGCQFCSSLNTCAFSSNNSGCSCNNLPQSFCEKATGCHFCDSIGLCASSTENSQCTCQLYDSTMCGRAKPDTCHWCGSFCDNKNNSQCSCQYLTEGTCISPSVRTAGTCTWCPNTNLCAKSSEYCFCSYVEEPICELNSHHQYSESNKNDYYGAEVQMMIDDGDNNEIENNNNNNNNLPALSSPSSCNRWCPTQNICINPQVTTGCACEDFNELQCQRSSTCQWCSSSTDPELNISICVPKTAKCECQRSSEAACTKSWSNCNWCPNQQLCVDPNNNLCRCDLIFDRDLCARKTNKYCSYCDSSEVCLETLGYPSNCECLNLDTTACKLSHRNNKCQFCPTQNVCIDPNVTTPKATCLCAAFSSDRPTCAASKACQWQNPISILGKGAPSYCSAFTDCPPVTCEAIPNEPTCRAAGCQYERGSCESTTCFNFFLSSFVSQSYILLILGCLKDLGVLLFIGVYGDRIGRRIAKIKYFFIKLKNGGAVPNRLDETVYLCDEFLRDSYIEGLYDDDDNDDDNDDKKDDEKTGLLSSKTKSSSSSKYSHIKLKKKTRSGLTMEEQYYDYSFEDYVILVRDKLFDISDIPPQLLFPLFDSIAFALVDTKRWVEVDAGSGALTFKEKEEEDLQDDDDDDDDEDDNKNKNNGEQLEEEDAMMIKSENNINSFRDDHHEGAVPSGYSELSTAQFYYPGSPEYKKNKKKLKKQQQKKSSSNMTKNTSSSVVPSFQSTTAGDEDNSKSYENFTPAAAAAKESSSVTASSATPIAVPTMSSNQQPSSSGFLGSQNSLSYYKTYKLKPEDFEKGTVHLQKIISDTVFEHADYAIYYAQSRDVWRRISSAINVFPSVPQLMFYMSGIFLMFALALHSVFHKKDRVQEVARGCASFTNQSGPTEPPVKYFHHQQQYSTSSFWSHHQEEQSSPHHNGRREQQQQQKHAEEIRRKAEAFLNVVENEDEIGDSTTNTTTSTPTTVTSQTTVGPTDDPIIFTTTTQSPNPNPDSRQGVATSLSTASYFLIGFRILNSSTFATSCLVFVKVIRGIWQRFKHDSKLTVQQKIPVMAVFTNRKLQVMLFIYASVVSPFAFAGLFYGPKVGSQPLVPLGVAVGLLIINFVSLKWVRYRANKDLMDKVTNFGDGDDDSSTKDSGSFDVVASDEGTTAENLLRKSPYRPNHINDTYNYDDLDDDEDGVNTTSKRSFVNNSSTNKDNNKSSASSPTVSKTRFSSANNNKNNNNTKKNTSKNNKQRNSTNKSNSKSRFAANDEMDDDAVERHSLLTVENSSFTNNDNTANINHNEVEAEGSAFSNLQKRVERERQQPHSILKKKTNYYRGRENDDDDSGDETEKVNETNENDYDDAGEQRPLPSSAIGGSKDDDGNDLDHLKGTHNNKSVEFRPPPTNSSEEHTMNSTGRFSSRAGRSARGSGTRVSRARSGRPSEYGEEISAVDDAATTLAVAEPSRLGNALIIFLLTQEIPTLILAISLQLSFNYTSLLQYAGDYGLEEDPNRVYGLDFNARRWHCMVEMLEGDLSAISSDMSSILPFL